MEKLVQFRMLSDTLSVDEYRAVISNVLDDNNKEEFSCMLFTHLHKKLKKQNAKQTSNGLQINTINQEINRIISQRKLDEGKVNVHEDETDDESESHQPLNIAHFTDVIIQEIASYLPFKSFSNFQCCSRSIFYAANSPFALYELHYGDLTECLSGKNTYETQLFMKRFEMIKSLVVYYDQQQYIPLVRFKNLKRLQLAFPNENAVEQYLSKNTFNWDTITHLDVRHNYCLEIVKRCKHLHTLVINEFYDDANVEPTMSQQLAEVDCLHSLRSLDLSGEVTMDVGIVLKNICNTLQSLSVDIMDHSMYMHGLTFNNLEELYIWFAEPNDIISMIQRTKHLKRLILDESVADIDTENDDSYHLAFQKVFALPTLEYCYFNMNDYDTDISELPRWIESSFRQKRDILKLEINSCMFGGQSLDAIYDAIVRIWNAMCAWHKSHIMLVFIFPSNKKVSELSQLTRLKQWLDSISNIFSVNIVLTKNDSNYVRKVVIASKLSIFIE